MKAARILRSPLILGVLLLACVPMPAHASQSSAARIFKAPRHNYLALGDSLAFGYQQFKIDAEVAATGSADPTTFTTGYVNDFATMLTMLRPHLRTANYGCPGETTSSFLNGGCPYPFALHNSFSGAQMSAALTFLHAHPNTSPITIDLGANDLLGLVNQCGGVANIACIQSGAPAVIGQVYGNLNQILGELRQAAPHSEIIVMALYNPLAVVDASTNAISVPLNAAIAAAALANQARVADAFTPFNLAQPQPQVLCVLTLMCTANPDIHASDAGYAVIAQQFWTASGYGTLGHEDIAADGPDSDNS